MASTGGETLRGQRGRWDSMGGGSSNSRGERQRVEGSIDDGRGKTESQRLFVLSPQKNPSQLGFEFFHGVVDFFKEVSQFCLKAGPALSNPCGADWERRLQAKELQTNFVHLTVVSKYYKRAYMDLLGKWTWKETVETFSRAMFLIIFDLDGCFFFHIYVFLNTIFWVTLREALWVKLTDTSFSWHGTRCLLTCDHMASHSHSSCSCSV
ncbi:Retinoblastoma-related protein 1 [Nymphaea thermarum]|nr:Retinoblastoma-related protein 1 [Nymphaea thermarum]